VVSFIGKAKRSVDSTVDAYMGRAAFAVSNLFAIVFAMAGIWLLLVDHYGTTIACFGIAGILVLMSLIIRATIAVSERAAEKDIEDVEKTIENTGLAAVSAIPFDLSTAMAVLPVVLPLVKSLRSVLPYLLVVGLIVGYFMSTSNTQSEERTEPVPAPA
jgi:hypothetical protein